MITTPPPPSAKPGEGQLRLDSALAATDSEVFVVTPDGVLVALDAGTGETRWQVGDALSAAHGGLARPVVVGDVVVVRTGDGHLRALAADTGVVRWTVGPFAANAVTQDPPGALLVAGNAAGGTVLRALELSDGSQRWQRTFALADTFAADLVYWRGVAVIRTEDGFRRGHRFVVSGISEQGRTLWSVEALRIWAGTRNGVLLKDEDIGLIDVDVHSGRTRWHGARGEPGDIIGEVGASQRVVVAFYAAD